MLKQDLGNQDDALVTTAKLPSGAINIKEKQNEPN
jgi:hypothetical protein